jgi:hypothetical protein
VVMTHSRHSMVYERRAYVGSPCFQKVCTMGSIPDGINTHIKYLIELPAVCDQVWKYLESASFPGVAKFHNPDPGFIADVNKILP